MRQLIQTLRLSVYLLLAITVPFTTGLYGRDVSTSQLYPSTISRLDVSYHAIIDRFPSQNYQYSTTTNTCPKSHLKPGPEKSARRSNKPIFGRQDPGAPFSAPLTLPSTTLDDLSPPIAGLTTSSFDYWWPYPLATSVTADMTPVESISLIQSFESLGTVDPGSFVFTTSTPSPNGASLGSSSSVSSSVTSSSPIFSSPSSTGITSSIHITALSPLPEASASSLPFSTPYPHPALPKHSINQLYILAPVCAVLGAIVGGLFGWGAFTTWIKRQERRRGGDYKAPPSKCSGAERHRCAEDEGVTEKEVEELLESSSIVGGRLGCDGSAKNNHHAHSLRNKTQDTSNILIRALSLVIPSRQASLSSLSHNPRATAKPSTWPRLAVGLGIGLKSPFAFMYERTPLDGQVEDSSDRNMSSHHDHSGEQPLESDAIPGHNFFATNSGNKKNFTSPAAPPVLSSTASSQYVHVPLDEDDGSFVLDRAGSRSGWYTADRILEGDDGERRSNSRISRGSRLLQRIQATFGAAVAADKPKRNAGIYSGRGLGPGGSTPELEEGVLLASAAVDQLGVMPSPSMYREGLRRKRTASFKPSSTMTPGGYGHGRADSDVKLDLSIIPGALTPDERKTSDHYTPKPIRMPIEEKLMRVRIAAQFRLDSVPKTLYGGVGLNAPAIPARIAKPVPSPAFSTYAASSIYPPTPATHVADPDIDGLFGASVSRSSIMPLPSSSPKPSLSAFSYKEHPLPKILPPSPPLLNSPDLENRLLFGPARQSASIHALTEIDLTADNNSRGVDQSSRIKEDKRGKLIKARTGVAHAGRAGSPQTARSLIESAPKSNTPQRLQTSALSSRNLSKARGLLKSGTPNAKRTNPSSLERPLPSTPPRYQGPAGPRSPTSGPVRPKSAYVSPVKRATSPKQRYDARHAALDRVGAIIQEGWSARGLNGGM